MMKNSSAIKWVAIITLTHLLTFSLTSDPAARDAPHKRKAFQPVASGAFSPTDVADLALWLKADSLSLSDDDPVSTWTDSSGLGHDATQSLTARPLYKTAIVNSKPVVRFDGINDWLSVADTATLEMSADSTVFLVLSWTAGIGIVQTVLDKQGGYVAAAYSLTLMDTIASPPGGVQLDRPYVEGGVPSADELAAASFNILETHVSGTAVAHLTNGVSVGTDTLAAGTAGNDALRIGAGFGAGAAAYFLKADVAEMCIYNRALNSTERGTVRTYLRSKYGVTAP